MSTTIQEREATSVTSPVKNEPVVEPLYPEFLRAAERLRGKPWRRLLCGTNAGGDGTECMMNALSVSGGGRNAAERMGFASLTDAWAWNDAPGRTLAEVLERLERAAYGL